MQQQIEINSKGIQVFKSRFGYHPCNYETFLKIKKIRKHYYESLPKAKNYYRWARKAEQNRTGQEPVVPPVFCELVPSENNGIVRERRNVCGQRYASIEKTIGKTEWIKCSVGEGFIYIIPMKYEPEVYESRAGSYTVYNSVGFNHDKTVIVRDLGIEGVYQQARMPKESPDDVGMFMYTPEQIDEMLQEIEVNQ